MVQQTPLRLVIDTNVVVRAFINPRSTSGSILKACEVRRVIPLLSTAVLREYREILQRPSILKRYPELKRPENNVALERVLYFGDLYRRVQTRFSFPRDPKDEPFLELAIAAQATHLVTTDDDMLSLPTGRDDAARRFRQRAAHTQILPPEEFMQFLTPPNVKN